MVQDRATLKWADLSEVLYDPLTMTLNDH